MKSAVKITAAVFLFLLIFSVQKTSAQCSVCRAGAESSVEAGKTSEVTGLNKGILYLMSIPYVMGGVAFYIWKKNRGKK